MAKAFDKDSWLAQKEQRLQDAKTALEDGLKALQSSDDWRRMLEGMAQVGALSVGRYSFQNQILIWQQRPGTRLAATFQTWREHGRFVRKGEKGMCILAPIVKKVAEDDADKETKELRLVGFRLVTVFGVDQTDGDALPEVQLPNITADEAFEGSVETLREIALSIDGNPVSGMEFRTRQEGDPRSALGWYNPKTKHIVVLTDGQSRRNSFRRSAMKWHTPCCIPSEIPMAHQSGKSRPRAQRSSFATRSGSIRARRAFRMSRSGLAGTGTKIL